MKKILVIFAVVAAVVGVIASGASASVRHTPESFNLTYLGKCITITTDNSGQQTLLSTSTAVEVIVAPWGTFPGWYTSDYDSDASGAATDPDDALVGCATGAPTESGADDVPLCFSKSGTNTMPGFFTFDTAQALLAGGGYTVADAVNYTVTGDPDVIGSYTLVCNPAGTATQTWLQQDKSVINASTHTLDVQAFTAGIDAPNQIDTKDFQIYS